MADLTNPLSAIAVKATVNPANAVFDLIRNQIVVALFPPTTPGFKGRIIGFVAVAV